MANRSKIKNDLTVVGADGCQAGWIAVQIDSGGAWKVGVYPDAATLWKKSADARLILIDIPIGLPDHTVTSRRCDMEARRLLGWPRASSIFSPPSRTALDSSLSYAAACRRNNEEVGMKISRQAYSIRGKIKQVDDLLQNDPTARRKFREVHPEVCFWALNGCRAMKHNKKTHRGFQERLRVLNRVFPASWAVIEQGLASFRRMDVARDDIVDALVGAVTAWKPGHLSNVLDVVETDARELRMEMVYHRLSD